MSMYFNRGQICVNFRGAIKLLTMDYGNIISTAISNDCSLCGWSFETIGFSACRYDWFVRLRDRELWEAVNRGLLMLPFVKFIGINDQIHWSLYRQRRAGAFLDTFHILLDLSLLLSNRSTSNMNESNQDVKYKSELTSLTLKLSLEWIWRRTLIYLPHWLNRAEKASASSVLLFAMQSWNIWPTLPQSERPPVQHQRRSNAVKKQVLVRIIHKQFVIDQLIFNVEIR